MREGHNATWGELSLSKVAAPGQEDLWLIVAQDVTERRKTEDSLRDTEKRLHQAEKAQVIGLLAGGVAHDFNNLLAIIMGYSEEALRRAGAADAVRTDLEGISRAALKGAQLTRQLLRFCRQDSGKPGRLNLNRCVTDLAPLLRRLLGEHISLEVSLDVEATQVEADSVQIEQILFNLTANARDAMPDGGTLIVSTRNREISLRESAVQSAIPPGSYVTLSAADTGFGMDMLTVVRIFEPFYTTKAAGQGTGLGLVTVQRLVRQLRGHIAVDTNPGRGTRFTIYLPALKAATEPKAAENAPYAATAAAEDARAAAVLLVEDEESLRKLMSSVLTEAGYNVLEAADGAAALAIADRYSGRLDLLITDLRLPGLLGSDVAKRLIGVRPDLKILYISGDLGRLDTENPASILERPFTPQALIVRVDEALGRRESGMSNSV